MSVNRHPRLLTAGITFRDLVISGIDELPGLGPVTDRSRRRPQLRDVSSGIDRVGH